MRIYFVFRSKERKKLIKIKIKIKVKVEKEMEMEIRKINKVYIDPVWISIQMLILMIIRL